MWFTANVNYGNDIHSLVSGGTRLLLLQNHKIKLGICDTEIKFMPVGGIRRVLNILIFPFKKKNCLLNCVLW